MTEAVDSPYIVQFPHPGGEHHQHGLDMDWNRAEHRRKFLKTTGTYLDGAGIKRGPITFWGEWEPQSRVVESYPPGLPDGPRWLHEPWWEVPRHRRLLQNTDPLVFGDRFRYSNCRQTRNAALRRLPPGSLVLFGSALRGDFRPESDVDLLVEFEPGRTPGLAFFGIQDELAALLGRTVDLNTAECLSPFFRDEVVRSAEVLYDAG